MPMGMLISEPMFHYGRDVAGSGRLVLKNGGRWAVDVKIGGRLDMSYIPQYIFIRVCRWKHQQYPHGHLSHIWIRFVHLRPKVKCITCSGVVQAHRLIEIGMLKCHSSILLACTLSTKLITVVNQPRLVHHTD